MSMQLVYLILLLMALIALNWRFLGFDKLFGARRRCRWMTDRRMQGGQYGRYVCDECGAEAFTSTGRPPRDCRDPAEK